MQTDRGNTVFIGDQLFTDVWGAKRTGMKSILVKPIYPKEEIQIVLKRYLEKIVLHFYKKENEKRMSCKYAGHFLIGNSEGTSYEIKGTACRKCAKAHSF